MNLLLIGLAAVLFATVSIDALSCKDQSGKNVDWFVAYKLPQLQKKLPDAPLVKDGTAFLYMDTRIKKKGWRMTTVGIDKKEQAIAYTLQQVYDNLEAPDHFYMMYNDEHALGSGKTKSDGYRAHAKGVVLFNEKDGIWLIHSIPGFPPPKSYGFADESKEFGQSLMCIAFKTSKSLGELTEQWYRFQLSVYASNLPTEFAQKYPNLVDIVASKPPNSKTSLSRVANLQSKGSVKFVHFAKNKKWNQDLYANLVVPELKTNMYVETWLRGLGDLKSGCANPGADQTVSNVREVSPDGVRFDSDNDHSKWAVSEEAEDGYTCVGDINRQASQFERGGGTMCFKDPYVWKAYRNVITQRELCVDKGKDGDQPNGPFEPVSNSE